MSVTITRVTFLCLLTFPSVYQCPRAKSNNPTSSCLSCCWQLSLVHLVVTHFQAVLCFSFVGQSCSKPLLKEPPGQLLHPEPRVHSLNIPLSHHCVRLWLDFTLQLEEQSEDVCTITAILLQTCLAYHSTGGHRVLGGTRQQSWPERPFNDACFYFSATSETPTLSPITGVES